MGVFVRKHVFSIYCFVFSLENLISFIFIEMLLVRSENNKITYINYKDYCDRRDIAFSTRCVF